MGSNGIALSGPDPRHVRQAFLLIAAIVKAQWEIIGESFFVWMEDDTRTSVERLAGQFRLRSRLPSKKNRRGSAILQALTTPKQRQLSFDLAHQGSSLIPVNGTQDQEEKKQGSSGGKGGRKSRRPPDEEFLKSLQERGLEGTASRYGVTPWTVKNLWAKAVPGAKVLIPDRRKARL